MIKGFLNLPWLLWAGIAFIIAVIYTFVWPHKAAAEAEGFRFFILRWGHALVWILLTINLLLRGVDPSYDSVANWLGLVAGLIYILFVVTSFVMK